MFQWEVVVVLRVSKPNQKGAVLVLEAARPGTVNAEVSLRVVQRSHCDFANLVRFQM